MYNTVRSVILYKWWALTCRGSMHVLALLMSCSSRIEGEISNLHLEFRFHTAKLGLKPPATYRFVPFHTKKFWNSADSAIAWSLVNPYVLRNICSSRKEACSLAITLSACSNSLQYQIRWRQKKKVDHVNDDTFVSIDWFWLHTGLVRLLTHSTYVAAYLRGCRM